MQNKFVQVKTNVVFIFKLKNKTIIGFENQVHNFYTSN